MTKTLNNKLKVIQKVKTPSTSLNQCNAIGCNRLASASTNKGINSRFCTRHEDHKDRHGSYHKSSYTAKQINPYRKAALKWLKLNQQYPIVNETVYNISYLYNSAGKHIEAFRLNGMSPEKRARAAWARLRKAEIDKLTIIASWLAVELIELDHPELSDSFDFKLVQGAKIIHRLASGTHKRWETQGYDGKIRVTEMHKYPRSRGRILIHLGKSLQKACSGLTTHHLMDIKAYKDAMPVKIPRGSKVTCKVGIRKKPLGLIEIQTDTTGAVNVESVYGTLVVRW